MLSDADVLGWLRVSGSPYEVGYALGQHGREAVYTDLIRSDIWSQVVSPKYRSVVDKMVEITALRFPAIFAEIGGLADGLGLPFNQVFAWNCRGDLLARTSDGCTTVQIPGEQIVIAHNEDGLPFFDGQSFIVEITGEGGFTSFCYPGSIPGHTFGVTNSDLVVTVNNLRLTHIEVEIPRMVLARALLNCTALDNARQLLVEAPISGGFHLSLAQRGDPRLMSVEFGGGTYREALVTVPSLHANHAILDGHSQRKQIITQSSRDRQKRGSTLVNHADVDPISILRDVGSVGLPIWRREPDDPDNENTIASAVFKITSTELDWTFYAGGSKKPHYESNSKKITGEFSTENS